MKIQLASDLHLDILERSFSTHRVIEPAAADVLVIAGDIHRGTGAFAKFADWPVPVIYVHGNHELYHQQYDDLLASMRAASSGSHIHWLEQDEYVLDGVRFLGCCLWTDYHLYPDQEPAAMKEASERLLDHRVIETPQGCFTPQDALRIHQQSRAWLETKLAEEFDGATVVVTHHGPHPNSVHPRYAGSLLNAAFVSDLTPLVARADLWLHGHVHDSFDYTVSGTRVIANPRGYALNRAAAQSPEQIAWENPAFDAGLVVTIENGYPTKSRKPHR